MNPYLSTLIHLVTRYLHIVCATLLVGGTLFFEMVVPIAIEDLHEEQKLLIFARARWVFRGIVWISAVLLLVTGIYATAIHWPEYANEGIYRLPVASAPPAAMAAYARPGWWWVAHASTGLLAILVSLSLMIGNVPPSQPIRWMRVNLIILLLVMFFATATRQARIQVEQRALSASQPAAELHD